MISTTMLIAWLGTIVPCAYFDGDFPRGAPELAAAVQFSPGFPPDLLTGITYPAFQVVVRGPPRTSEAEEKAIELQTGILSARGTLLEGNRIIVCEPEQSAPAYIGRDESDRRLYSLNFQMTIQEGA